MLPYTKVSRSLGKRCYDDQAGHDRGVKATRAQPDEDAFAKAWKEGQSMSMDQSVEYALERQLPALFIIRGGVICLTE